MFLKAHFKILLVRKMSLALKCSDVVFMNQGEPDIYEAYGATVVAWGGGPDNENQINEWRQRIQKTREMGIRYSCSNAWMLTATAEALVKDPGLRQAVCVDINYNPIIPPWLWDYIFREVPSYWGCTNNPRFREHLRNRIILSAQAGADGLHLDDHIGTAGTIALGGCYCDYCMKGFREYLKKKYTLKDLKEKGINDIESFNYREMVCRVAHSRQTFINAYKQGEIPLIEEFQTCQLEAAATLVKELGDLAKKLLNKPIPVSINSYQLLPTQIVDSPYVDYFVTEVPHNAQERKIPASLIFVYKFADALNKPLAATAAGQDWAYIKENNLTKPVKLFYLIYAQS